MIGPWHGPLLDVPVNLRIEQRMDDQRRVRAFALAKQPDQPELGFDWKVLDVHGATAREGEALNLPSAKAAADVELGVHELQISPWASITSRTEARSDMNQVVRCSVFAKTEQLFEWYTYDADRNLVARGQEVTAEQARWWADQALLAVEGVATPDPGTIAELEASMARLRAALEEGS